MDKINIIKASGEKAPFEIEKVIRSLERAGADKLLIKEIVQDIDKEVHDGMTTKKIYQMAFNILKRKSRVSASKYKLKKALMELGPSGYLFERFVGKVFGHEGYETKVGIIVQGHCVQHEIDVIAKKDNKHFMIECKYHSDQGRFCNVKIPLYIQSRFLDVQKQWEKQQGHKTKFHQGGVCTNTRFTSDALQFGNCVGLMLVSWDHPKGHGLKERVDRLGLHPLTSLTTLTKAEKSKLLDAGIVLCKEINENPSLLEQIGIPKQRQKNIIKDSRELCTAH